MQLNFSKVNDAFLTVLIDKFLNMSPINPVNVGANEIKDVLFQWKLFDQVQTKKLFGTQGFATKDYYKTVYDFRNPRKWGCWGNLYFEERENCYLTSCNYHPNTSTSSVMTDKNKCRCLADDKIKTKAVWFQHEGSAYKFAPNYVDTVKECFLHGDEVNIDDLALAINFSSVDTFVSSLHLTNEECEKWFNFNNQSKEENDDKTMPLEINEKNNNKLLIDPSFSFLEPYELKEIVEKINSKNDLKYCLPESWNILRQNLSEIRQDFKAKKLFDLLIFNVIELFKVFQSSGRFLSIINSFYESIVYLNFDLNLNQYLESLKNFHYQLRSKNDLNNKNILEYLTLVLINIGNAYNERKTNKNKELFDLIPYNQLLLYISELVIPNFQLLNRIPKNKELGLRTIISKLNEIIDSTQNSIGLLDWINFQFFEEESYKLENNIEGTHQFGLSNDGIFNQDTVRVNPLVNSKTFFYLVKLMNFEPPASNDRMEYIPFSKNQQEFLVKTSNFMNEGGIYLGGSNKVKGLLSKGVHSFVNFGKNTWQGITGNLRTYQYTLEKAITNIKSGNKKIILNEFGILTTKTTGFIAKHVINVTSEVLSPIDFVKKGITYVLDYGTTKCTIYFNNEIEWLYIEEALKDFILKNPKDELTTYITKTKK